MTRAHDDRRESVRPDYVGGLHGHANGARARTLLATLAVQSAGH